MELRVLQENENRKNPLFAADDAQSLLKMYEDFYPKIGFILPWVSYEF